MKKISIGVIGIGHLGTKHASALSVINEARLIGVCDINENKAKQVASDLKIDCFFDHRKLIKAAEAVIISAPTKQHFRIGHDALTKGCHVLIEKPIAATVKEANKLISLARKKRCVLQVGHIERFNNTFKAVCDVVKNPKFIECHRLSPFPARSLDIGVVSDLMIHDIDLILDLVNSNVAHIDAVGINVLTNLEDIANVRLRFKNGCIANLTASRISDEPMRKFRIFLKNSYISLDYKNNRAQIYRKDDQKITKQELNIKNKDPLTNELESFLDCILENKQPLVSGREGKMALELAIKIQKKINNYIRRNK